MAAKTLSSPTDESPTILDRFAGDTTADNLRQIDIHTATHYVSLRVVDAAGEPMAFKVTHTGTDAAAIGANYMRIRAGEWYEQSLPFGHGGTTIYVSGDSASPTIEVASSLRAP